MTATAESIFDIHKETFRVRLGLTIVLGFYIIVYGTLLLATNGLPYVFDNNETFSSIIHAKNMLTYGVSETYGLTDESYGNTAESHPYVYTHQGNFPRLFAALIYLLGAQSAEAQIAVTTFSIGLASVVLAYDLVARRAGWVIGMGLCLLIMTDYVMVAQWQVGTWRVWHMFFFFLCLNCADRVVTTHHRSLPWWITLMVAHVCLFYFELIYAAFAAATTTIFAFLTVPRRGWLIVRVALTQFLGMIVGLGILVGQLIAYLGWDNFVTDLQLTYSARNEGVSKLDALSQFMVEHRIVFWFNINQVEGLRQFSTLLKNFVSYTLGAYTPALVCIAIGPVVGLLARLITRSLINGRRTVSRRRIPVELAQVLILVFFAGYAAYVIIGYNVAEIPELGSDIASITILSGVAFLLGSALFKLVASVSENERVAVEIVVAGPLTMIGALFWMIGTEKLYGIMAPLWTDPVNHVVPETLQLVALFAGWAALRIACFSFSSQRLSDAMGRLSRLLRIPVSATLAFALVYMLSPGYVLTGYLQRYAPFNVFANICLLAIGFMAIAYVFRDDWMRAKRSPWWLALKHTSSQGIRVRPLPGTTAAALGILFIGGLSTILVPSYWLALQALYLKRLPPDHAEVIQKLRDPSFKGRSFVVNTYAAPVSVQTGEWAYLDSELGNLAVEDTDDGKRIIRDFRYLWLADRDTNLEYERPEYFLCFASQDISMAIWTQFRGSAGCSNMPIVKMAGQTIAGVLSSHLIAIDKTGRDRWAIVKLDWHAPNNERTALPHISEGIGHE